MSQDRTFYNQPVRSLQWMLRTIAQHDGDLDLLVPNGIYEPRTAGDRGHRPGYLGGRGTGL